MRGRFSTSFMLVVSLQGACGEPSADGAAGSPETGPEAALEVPPDGFCGSLPDDFVCQPGASGPGVYDGDLRLDSGFPEPPAGISCVTGSLTIEISDLVDLKSLNSLRSVGGSLSIRNNHQLTSLAGLEQLRDVRGTLAIEFNSQLSDASALGRLTRIDWLNPRGRRGAVSIHHNASLSQCAAWDIAGRAGQTCAADGLPGTNCSQNAGTSVCSPLPADFACVPGASGPGVHDGWMELAETPWPPLNAEWRGVRCVTGNVELRNPTSEDLSALRDLHKIGGSLELRQNQTLTHLDGLSRLEEIGGTLDIVDNEALENLAGLVRLRKLGDGTSSSLSVSGNRRLPSCWAWLIEEQLGLDPAHRDYGRYLNAPHGSCGPLPSDFACSPGARGTGVADSDLDFDSLPPEALGGLTCVTGQLQVRRSDVDVLRTLQKVGGDFVLAGADELTNMDAFERLTEVGQRLRIFGNARLGDLRGLRHLGWTPFGFEIFDNAQLSQCWVWELSRQMSYQCWSDCHGNHGTASCGTLPEDFECVPGAVGPGVYDGFVSFNEYTTGQSWGGVACITGSIGIAGSEVTDLHALSSLRFVGGSVEIRENQHLGSLDGLENLRRIGGSLFILNNPVLSDLGGLSSLERIGPPTWDDQMLIGWNQSLDSCWVERLEPQLGWSCPEPACYRNEGSGGCTP